MEIEGHQIIRFLIKLIAATEITSPAEDDEKGCVLFTIQPIRNQASRQV